ncbi:hypothetical protein PQX77_005007 [Marasmius sp. AFHP31]|nr:hypothetical protein PQX77_005007 [Marasmius sp. AFHP31]
MSNELEVQYPQRIMVDDIDPRITYGTGSRDLDGSAFVNNGVLGDPYNKTMRGTNSARASLAFSFEGDYIQVRGARDNGKIPPPLNDTGFDVPNTFPVFTCQIDNDFEPFPRYATYYKYYVTNVPLCEKANLSKGRHTLTMTITINDPSRQVFWLDSIEYSPLATANLTQEVLRVYSNDPRGYMNTSSASISFKFNGTAVSLYGMDLRGSLQDTPHIGTTGSYNIDSGESVQFEIPGSETLPFLPGDIEGYGWYNQRLFHTGLLNSDKEHEIVISYDGNNSSKGSLQPLLVDYFLVENNRPQAESSLPGSGREGESGDSGKISVGGIAGGVAGGILAIIAIAVLAWFMRRRKRQRDESRILEPFDIRTEAQNRQIASAQNLERQKQARREAVNTTSRQEVDSGLRYGDIHTAHPSRNATLPPLYTAE